jgi:hypothetical protein
LHLAEQNFVAFGGTLSPGVQLLPHWAHRNGTGSRASIGIVLRPSRALWAWFIALRAQRLRAWPFWVAR